MRSMSQRQLAIGRAPVGALYDYYRIVWGSTSTTSEFSDAFNPIALAGVGLTHVAERGRLSQAPP